MDNNITEDYVSFEVAKLLKDKGFDVFTMQGYFNYIGSLPHLLYPNIEIFGSNYLFKNSSDFTQNENPNAITNDNCCAPTQALAIKWIRLNFGIHISAACYYNPQRLDKIMYEAEISYEGNGYDGLLKNASNRLNVDWTKEPEKYWIFNTPEEATNAALLYTLKHLI